MEITKDLSEFGVFQGSNLENTTNLIESSDDDSNDINRSDLDHFFDKFLKFSISDLNNPIMINKLKLFSHEKFQDIDNLEIFAQLKTFEPIEISSRFFDIYRHHEKVVNFGGFDIKQFVVIYLIAKMYSLKVHIQRIKVLFAKIHKHNKIWLTKCECERK